MFIIHIDSSRLRLSNLLRVSCTHVLMILNIQLYTNLSFSCVERERRSIRNISKIFDTPVTTRRFLPRPSPALCSPGTERSHDGLTHILMGYRGEPTGMMTRHRPATGARMGETTKSGLVGITTKARGRFRGDIRRSWYQDGRIRRILRQDSRERASQNPYLMRSWWQNLR